MPELGNLFLGFDDWYARYKELLEKSGELLLNRIYNTNIPQPFCLLCAEKKATECHRKLIADYLVVNKNWEVEHL